MSNIKTVYIFFERILVVEKTPRPLRITLFSYETHGYAINENILRWTERVYFFKYLLRKCSSRYP